MANSLLNNLIAYWPGNEASGNALDLHTNALHLTDTNTVTSAAGLVYAGARQYTAATAEFHTRAGDDALLSTGDVDFTIAQWVNLDSLAATHPFACKYTTSGQYEYRSAYTTATSRFRFTVSANGTSGVNIDANNLGLPVVGTWYLIIEWHDSVADTINIQVNDGVANSVGHVLGVYNGTDAFRIGTSLGAYMSGRIGPTMFWKSAAGGGGVLTAAQRTALYNAGAGLTYALFDAGAVETIVTVPSPATATAAGVASSVGLTVISLPLFDKLLGDVLFHGHSEESHATQHRAGGTDTLKLDDLTAADDTTDLNATATAHGLLPKGDDSAVHFLNGDIGWATPDHTAISNIGTNTHAQIDTHIAATGASAHGDSYVLNSGDTMTGGLVLAAGTTAILPLKFVSGPLLTSATAGGIEFLNNSLYFTGTTGGRKTIALAETLVMFEDNAVSHNDAAVYN